MRVTIFNENNEMEEQRGKNWMCTSAEKVEEGNEIRIYLKAVALIKNAAY